MRDQGDIGMVLYINVTWPCDLGQIRIPIDCFDMEAVSNKASRSGNHIVIDGAFGQGNRVCDDDRYRIDRQKNGPLERCQPGTGYGKTLVILLESPHRDEYSGNCIDRPIKPAMGTAGRNIRNHLINVVHSCPHLKNRLDPNTRVIIANPIQFQCSLVSVITSGDWKKIRDAVWKALWNRQEIQNEFRKRLKGYNPNFIINACTHDLGCYTCLDQDKECRKKKIHDFLVENFPCAHIYAAAHPSSRHWKGKGLRRFHRRERRFSH